MGGVTTSVSKSYDAPLDQTGRHRCMYELPGTRTGAALGAIAGAVLADLALARLDAVRGVGAVMRLPIAGGLFAALVWTGHLLGMHLASGGLRWSAELISGSVVFAAAIGVVLGFLATAVPGAPMPGTKTPGAAVRWNR